MRAPQASPATTQTPNLLPKTDTSPDMTVIVPALNEEATIVEVLERLLMLDLVTQIIVVDDGSTDKTNERVRAFLGG